MDPKDLDYRYIKNTALGYSTNSTPLSGPDWESGSVNFLTSVRQYLEKAPGFAAYESSATVFTGTIKRIFTWERWDGTFYILVCEVYAGHSKVWKLKVGTDAAFVSLYDDDSRASPLIGEPFDFCISNDKCYFANGQCSQVYEGGSIVRQWGILTNPMVGTVGPPDYTGGQPVSTVSAAAGSMSATVGYIYTYSYGNSSTNHISSASNPSLTTGVFTAKSGVTITGIGTTDTQADLVHVFRTTDGGSGMYFELPNSPISAPAAGGATVYATSFTAGATTAFQTSSAHGFSNGDLVTILYVWTDDPAIVLQGTWTVTVTGGTTFTIPVNTTGRTIYTTPFGASCQKASTWTITDTATDAALSSFQAPVGNDLSTNSPPTPLGQNDPPLFDTAVEYGASWKGVTWFANRIWGFFKNTLYYTVWEEKGDYGLEEECVPKSNFFVFSQPIKALATNDEFLLVFTATTVWKISGDSLDTFSRSSLFSNIGVRNRSCIARLGKAIAWFDLSHSVRITDGFQQREVSLDIRPDLASVDPDKAALSFFCNANYNWLCLLDGETQMFIYDLDLNQWLPPWTFVGACSAIHWGETAAGEPLLLVGSAGKKILKMMPSTYTFDGSTYTAVARSSLLDIVETDKIASTANAQLITIERNEVQLSDVLELRDEEPSTGTYVTDYPNIMTKDSISPPLRPQADSLVEEWFGTQQIGCKRMSLQFEWAAASTKFILYSFGIGSHKL